MSVDDVRGNRSQDILDSADDLDRVADGPVREAKELDFLRSEDSGGFSCLSHPLFRIATALAIGHVDEGNQVAVLRMKCDRPAAAELDIIRVRSYRND